ncbi:hypothetical protein HDV01_002648 [Terramyces sp. JEL0728]|nr:hypothetical protein HDV01_002648 [Terramyces sp. JEL0728]
MKVLERTNSSKCAHTHEILDHGGPTSFGRTYFSLCQLYSLPILPHVINHENNHLLLDVERIVKDEEWSPILKALRKNRDLVKVCVYSADTISTTEIGNRFESHTGKSIVRVLPDLIGGIKDCLLHNSFLTTLEISGIGLRETVLKTLSKGLLNNTRIKNFSLSRSNIGDSGIFVLAPAIRTILHLQVLNLSGCELGEKGAYIIAAFLKSLAVRRQADKWAYSLRNNVDAEQKFPSKEAPCPLKRLILCCNKFGDKGCVPLFELLFEEVGLKEKSGLFAHEMIKNNTEILLLDLRNNKISNEAMNIVHQRLANNLTLHGNADGLLWLDSKDPLKSSYHPERIKSRSKMHTTSSIKKYRVGPPKDKRAPLKETQTLAIDKNRPWIMEKRESKGNDTRKAQSVQQTPVKTAPPISSKSPKLNAKYADSRKSAKSHAPNSGKSLNPKPKLIDFGKVQSVLDLYYPPQTDSEALQETIDYDLNYLDSLYRHIENEKKELERTPQYKLDILQKENEELKMRLNKLEGLLITSKYNLETQGNGILESSQLATSTKGALYKSHLDGQHTTNKSVDHLVLLKEHDELKYPTAAILGEIQKTDDHDLLNIIESSIASFHKILDVWERD